MAWEAVVPPDSKVDGSVQKWIDQVKGYRNKAGQSPQMTTRSKTAHAWYGVINWPPEDVPGPDGILTKVWVKQEVICARIDGNTWARVAKKKL